MIPNPSSEAMWQMMPDRHLFTDFSTGLPAWQEVFGRDLRLCGGNDRWICVQSPTRVEIIDLLTGQNLWSLHTPPGNHDVFATESCVFLSRASDQREQTEHHPKPVTCLNRIDGTVRSNCRLTGTAATDDFGNSR